MNVPPGRTSYYYEASNQSGASHRGHAQHLQTSIGQHQRKSGTPSIHSQMSSPSGYHIQPSPGSTSTLRRSPQPAQRNRGTRDLQAAGTAHQNNLQGAAQHAEIGKNPYITSQSKLQDTAQHAERNRGIKNSQNVAKDAKAKKKDSGVSDQNKLQDTAQHAKGKKRRKNLKAAGVTHKTSLQEAPQLRESSAENWQSSQGTQLQQNTKPPIDSGNDSHFNSRVNSFRKSVMYDPPEGLKGSARLHFSAYNAYMATLSVVLCLFLLGLLIACVALAVEVGRLRSELNSLNRTLSVQRVQLANETTKSYSSRLDFLQANDSTFYPELTEKIHSMHTEFYREVEGHHPNFPAISCSTLPPIYTSGYYWITASNGTSIRAYCDMSHTCGSIRGGWMRVLDLDMSKSNNFCPNGLQEQRVNGIRACVRILSQGCTSMMLPTLSVNYRTVCGKIIGYQFGYPNAVRTRSIESSFLDGITLSYGQPRQHIWSFPVAIDEVRTPDTMAYCLCINIEPGFVVYDVTPQFLSQDYFCDTGAEMRSKEPVWYTNDPLWDGVGCGNFSRCCTFQNPPWFYKQLPQSTTENIEMRLCLDEDQDEEDIAIEKVAIYVR